MIWFHKKNGSRDNNNKESGGDRKRQIEEKLDGNDIIGGKDPRKDSKWNDELGMWRNVTLFVSHSEPLLFTSLSIFIWTLTYFPYYKMQICSLLTVVYTLLDIDLASKLALFSILCFFRPSFSGYPFDIVVVLLLFWTIVVAIKGY